MFNSVEEIHKIVFNTTKDRDCNVALGKQNYNYYLEIHWHQNKQSRGYKKVFSEQMIIDGKHMAIEDFILREIHREIEFNVGKIAYEES